MGASAAMTSTARAAQSRTGTFMTNLPLRGPGAQAEVWAARTEGDVVVRPARHVEPVRVVEDLLVAVRADVPRDHLVAGLDRLPAELVVLRRRPPEVQHGRRPSQDLLGRRPDEG